VTSALGLCYESLRRRVEEKSTRTRARTPRFVEMRAADLTGVVRQDGVVIELCATDGTRMPVRLYRPLSRAATDYALLAEDVLSLWMNDRRRPEPPIAALDLSAARRPIEQSQV